MMTQKGNLCIKMFYQNFFTLLQFQKHVYEAIGTLRQWYWS